MARKDHGKAKSIRSLGRQVGRAESTVRKWLARPDWPFSRTGPWDVSQVTSWMEIHLKPDPAKAYRKRMAQAAAGKAEFGELTAKQKADIQYKIERTLAVRQRRLKEAGDLHDARQCQERILRQIHAVRSSLLALPRSLSAQLVNASRDEIEAILTQRITELLEDFSHGD